MTVRDEIIAAVATALADLAPEIETEPSGDPSQFPSIAIFDLGHQVLEREVDTTRRAMSLMIEGYVEGGSGKPPTEARNALHAAVIAALMADETLGGLVELIDDDDARMSTATLASKRRLGFAQDFTIQFTTQRADPALPA